VFGIARSSYNYHLEHRHKVSPERQCLLDKATQIHAKSRGAAGARTIAGQLAQGGEAVGRHQAASLMREAGLVSKQPNKHKYKIAEDESRVAPNLLERNLPSARRIKCGAEMSPTVCPEFRASKDA